MTWQFGQENKVVLSFMGMRLSTLTSEIGPNCSLMIFSPLTSILQLGHSANLLTKGHIRFSD